MTEDAKCSKCDGCGKVATSKDQEPWRLWESLPHGSALSVRMGLVRPMICPDCKGSGRLGETDET